MNNTDVLENAQSSSQVTTTTNKPLFTGRMPVPNQKHQKHWREMASNINGQRLLVCICLQVLRTVLRYLRHLKI